MFSGGEIVVICYLASLVNSDWALEQSCLIAWLLPLISTYLPTDAHRFLIAAVVFMLPAFCVRIWFECNKAYILARRRVTCHYNLLHSNHEQASQAANVFSSCYREIAISAVVRWVWPVLRFAAEISATVSHYFLLPETAAVSHSVQFHDFIVLSQQSFVLWQNVVKPVCVITVLFIMLLVFYVHIDDIFCFCDANQQKATLKPFAWCAWFILWLLATDKHKRVVYL